MQDIGAPHLADSDPEAPMGRVYSVCFFEHDALVPDVRLIDANSDDEAMQLARASRPSMTRELWDRHRLVGVIPAAGSARSRL